MRSAKWFVWPGVAIVCLATLGYTLLQAGDSPRRPLARNGIIQQRRDERRKLETNREWVRSRVINERGSQQTQPFDSPIFHESSLPRRTTALAEAGAPPPSPGQDIALTAYDMQANNSQAYQVARTGSNLANLHFTWMSSEINLSQDWQADRFAVCQPCDRRSSDTRRGGRLLAGLHR